ncbi:MAG TPA: dTMP kinase [bacterium]|nr:dTMP kinase [bacterium]
MARRGHLVSFEGMDGAGKTTQLELLAERLDGDRVPVMRLREPGGTPLGERVREMLLDRKLQRTPSAELLLFAAARAELVHRLILPAIEEGWIVLLDRYADSTRAYQGYGLGMTEDTVESAINLATEGLAPSLTILLDLDPAKGLRRLQTVFDAIEERSTSFLDRVRRGFLDIAHREPDRWLVLDASRSIPELAGEIWDRVMAIVEGGSDG